MVKWQSMGGSHHLACSGCYYDLPPQSGVDVGFISKSSGQICYACSPLGPPSFVDSIGTMGIASPIFTETSGQAHSRLECKKPRIPLIGTTITHKKERIAAHTCLHSIRSILADCNVEKSLHRHVLNLPMM